MKDKKIKVAKSYYFYFIGLVILMILLTGTAINSSSNSKSPKLAFALLVHDDDTINGAMELMDILYPSDHCFLVHFDKKAPTASVKNFLKLYPFVLVSKQFSVQWGKYSMVEAELELLSMSRQCEYDHLLFMDGNTYPLRRLLEIELLMKQIPRENSVVFSNIPEYGTDVPTCKSHSPTHHACSRTGARCSDFSCNNYTTTPNHAPLYKGPQWSILSSEFVQHLLSEKIWLNRWSSFFQQTMMPDESYFQTLLMDSPFKEKKSLLEEDWLKTVWKECNTYQSRKSKIGYSPCTLGIKDYSVHLEHSKSLFVRKIRAGDQLKSVILQ